MTEGHIRLHRRLLEWEWFSDSTTVHVLVYLLLRANWQRKVWQGHVIEPGQLITSRATIAEACGLSEKQVRLALDKLNRAGVITTDRAGLGQRVTLVNWADYQVEPSEKGRTRAALRAERGPIEGRSRAVTEEGEEGEEGKKGKNGAEAPGAEAPTLFGNPVLNDAVELLKAANGGALDGTVKANRRDAWTLINRLAKQYPSTDPIRSLRRLVELAKADPFHGRNATSFRYLLDNSVRIIESSNRKPTHRANGSQNRPTSVELLAREVRAGVFGAATVPGTADQEEDPGTGDADAAFAGDGL